MANTLCGGDLERRLRTLRREGMSHEEIVYALRDLQIQVSSRTVGAWLKQLHIDVADKAAS